MQYEHLTVVEPAILKAVQGVEQRHVEEANHLSNGIDGEEADNHTLEDHQNTRHNSFQHIQMTTRDTQTGTFV